MARMELISSRSSRQGHCDVDGRPPRPPWERRLSAASSTAAQTTRVSISSALRVIGCNHEIQFMPMWMLSARVMEGEMAFTAGVG